MTRTEAIAKFRATARAQRPHADEAYLEALATLAALAYEDHASALATDEPELSPLADYWEGTPSLAEVAQADPHELVLTYLQAYA